jgi:hypothetical protein
MRTSWQSPNERCLHASVQAENLLVIRFGNSLRRLIPPAGQMTMVIQQLLAAATARLVQCHHDQLKYCQRRIVDLRRIARG